MEKWSLEENKNFAAIDVGYISQNAYLYCASEGLATGARASVDRKALGQRLKLRSDQMITLAQSVGCAKP
jgi:nitroreductase